MSDSPPVLPPAIKGRGATNAGLSARFDDRARESDGDWLDAREDIDGEGPPLRTTVTIEHPKTIITRNQSPDLSFDRSINAYRGCEHGCIYCFARPTHAYQNLSPGLDFETRLFAKPDTAALLRKELAKPSYRCAPIALGTNTDPYQPIEREWKITRQVIEVLAECKHPLSIVTKSALVERDLDLLAQLAQDNLVQVYISVTTLDAELAHKLEPRASSPRRRLQAMRVLNEAGVPCGVLVAPVISFLIDAELENVLQAAHEHGARSAGYSLLRLPYELKELFEDWLATHYPLKAAHVMNRLREMRGGSDAGLGGYSRGNDQFSELLAQRFQIACGRLGLNLDDMPLDTGSFRPPSRAGQMALF